MIIELICTKPNILQLKKCLLIVFFCINLQPLTHTTLKQIDSSVTDRSSIFTLHSHDSNNQYEIALKNGIKTTIQSGTKLNSQINLQILENRGFSTDNLPSHLLDGLDLTKISKDPKKKRQTVTQIQKISKKMCGLPKMNGWLSKKSNSTKPKNFYSLYLYLYYFCTFKTHFFEFSFLIF